MCRSDTAHDVLQQSKLIFTYFQRLSLITYFFTETLTVGKKHVFGSKKQKKGILAQRGGIGYAETL